jgi:uncharacterized alpha-E superfamily protein
LFSSPLYRREIAQTHANAAGELLLGRNQNPRSLRIRDPAVIESVAALPSGLHAENQDKNEGFHGHYLRLAVWRKCTAQEQVASAQVM